MTDIVNFRVDWSTGYVEVKVPGFFIHSQARQVQKLRGLARRYSSEADREQLLETLRHENERMQRVLKDLGVIRDTMGGFLSDFDFSETPAVKPTVWERELSRRCKVLARNIELLTAERWGA